MIENVISRYEKVAAGKPYLEREGLTKSKVMADEAAMLYAIEAGSNKSKYYEMLILVARDGSAKLIRRWGRLGDKFRTKIEQHRDLDSARASMLKIKRSKMNGKSKYIDAFDSRRHKTPDGKQLPKGQYPVGLESNAGPWQNQSILSCKPALRKLVEKINEAVADAANEDMSAVIEDLQAADSLTSELGTSSMAKEIRKKIRGPLNRIQGTGRHRPDPAKAVRELKTLSRYLSKQMSLCMTASVLGRTYEKTASKPDFVWPLGALSHEDGDKQRDALQRLVGGEYKVWLSIGVGGTTNLHITPQRMDWEEFALAFRDQINGVLSGFLKKYNHGRINPSAVARSNSELLRHVKALGQTKTAASDNNILWGILDRRAYLKLARSFSKQGDTATATMMADVGIHLMQKLKLSNNERAALNRLSQSIQNPNWDISLHRNNLFKAADLLGMKLPHAMF